MHRQDYALITEFFARKYREYLDADYTSGAAVIRDVAASLAVRLAADNHAFDVGQFWHEAFPGWVPPGGEWYAAEPLGADHDWRGGVFWLADDGATPEDHWQCGHTHRNALSAQDCGVAEASARRNRARRKAVRRSEHAAGKHR